MRESDKKGVHGLCMFENHCFRLSISSNFFYQCGDWLFAVIWMCHPVGMLSFTSVFNRQVSCYVIVLLLLVCILHRYLTPKLSFM